MLSKSPAVCAGTPELSRVCTYTPTASTNTSTSSALATAGNFSFSDMGVDGEFSGMSRVKGIVSGASGVEYFLLNPSSNDISSLGAAEQTRENLWERSFDSTVFPNGPFYLMAKVRTTSGTRESSRMKIVIANRASTLSTTSTETSPASTGSDAETSESTAVAPATMSVAELKDFRGTTTGKWQKLYFGSDRCEREDFCGADADPDGDDLVNKDEFRYNTNPLAMDTDGDDFSDGKEVRDGFNPLLASRGDKNDQMTYESPKETGTVEKELFAVGNVEVVSSESDAEEKNLKLSGTGPANTLLNVFVYSELPTILTVKTDADGNWSYTLEKSLDDGEHQVYVAVTDHTGKIAAKSEPLAFVKTAQAATVIPPAEAETLENSVSPVEKRKVSDMMLLGIVAVFALLVAILLIGYLIRRKKAHAHNGETVEASMGNDVPSTPEGENDRKE